MTEPPLALDRPAADSFPASARPSSVRYSPIPRYVQVLMRWPWVDLGFRAFTLAASHHRQWSGVPEHNADELAKQMALFVDPLLPGWQVLPVIYELAMREGFSPSSRVEELPKSTTKPNAVYVVTDPDKDQIFRICLDDTLSPAIMKALLLRKDDLFICRDVSLTDEVAANLALQCRLKTI